MKKIFFILLFCILSFFGQTSSAVEKSGELYELEWDGHPDALRYEFVLFEEREGEEIPLYRKEKVWKNKIIFSYPPIPVTSDIYWKVRPYDMEGNPLEDPSESISFEGSVKKVTRHSPIPDDRYDLVQGMTLLYPVYSFTAFPGAVSYEIEVTDVYPENTDSVEPSLHRIWSGRTTNTACYDDEPRTGTFYWRVRSLDENGNALGIWSIPQELNTPLEGWTFGLYGDSISHGGGRLSYSPADGAYSLAFYLDFPVINLSESGDTSRTMKERFDKDVLPFHVKYLLIMGGTNSLRGGEDPASVISDLAYMGERCREAGITPIYLTLAPINPENIMNAFGEGTAEDWKDRFAKVNDWIRTQDHIDTAAFFEQYDTMPGEYAADGLHTDWKAKLIMADEINRHIGKFTALS